ncbi:hypothetical protein B0H14DRAFT_3600656 [Mycena olivaceomarginata]|nr:hypothetical protein B0H14DRAFT_3600656 [Mycena olivaceomarginata]
MHCQTTRLLFPVPLGWIQARSKVSAWLTRLLPVSILRSPHPEQLRRREQALAQRRVVVPRLYICGSAAWASVWARAHGVGAGLACGGGESVPPRAHAGAVRPGSGGGSGSSSERPLDTREPREGTTPTSLRAGTADSRHVSDATITLTSARISASSSAASSTKRIHSAAESDSPYPAKSNGFPGGWGSLRSAHGWGNAKAKAVLVDADGSRRSPPPLNTRGGDGAGGAGPSSSALSPLPYPQHIPWGVRVLGSFRTAALAGSGSDSTGNGNESDNRAGGAWGSFRQTAAPKPTTVVAGVGAGAGQSAESLGAGSGAVDLASLVEAAFAVPAHANGVNVVSNGTPGPDASVSASASTSTRTRTGTRAGRYTPSESAHSGSTAAPTNGSPNPTSRPPASARRTFASRRARARACKMCLGGWRGGWWSLPKVLTRLRRGKVGWGWGGTRGLGGRGGRIRIRGRGGRGRGRAGDGGAA